MKAGRSIAPSPPLAQSTAQQTFGRLLGPSMAWRAFTFLDGKRQGSANSAWNHYALFKMPGGNIRRRTAVRITTSNLASDD